MEQFFTNIYENCVWGNNENDNYKGSSGSGSSEDGNKDSYVPLVKNFIIDNNIKSVIDLGCGDFTFSPLIYDELDISYTGYDVYKKLVDYNSQKFLFPKYSFLHLDFFNNKEFIKNGDLCILKDVLQHWPLNNIYNFLDYLVENKKFKFILICNCCNQYQDNTDINRAGEWHALSSDFLPLKKYNPKKIYNYNTKEVCVIEIR